MRRKDGKPKTRSKRTLPVFECGFREHSSSAAFREILAGSRTVTSMFASCGGLDLGFLGGFQVFGDEFERLRFKISAAYDSLPDAVETYKLNLGREIQEADLMTLDAKNMEPADVLTGGFPCQDFSSSGPKTGLAGKRGQLYLALRDYMREHQPSVVVGENVPHLKRLNNGVYLRRIIEDLEAEGYSFEVWDLQGPKFGLPQSRRRLFLIGVRNDLFGFPIKPTGATSRFRPIDRGIEDLEEVTTEAVCNQSQFYLASRATSGGGQGDHTNRRGESAYCIRANPRGRIQFHYSLPRRLTVRECARLQSFPDEFVFPFTNQRNILLIGNAVPPLLGHEVAKAVQGFLDGTHVTEKAFSHGLAGASLFNQ